MTESLIGSRFKDALLYAVEIHGNDLRKGASIPYISHLLSVCALVLEDGGDEEEAIAALLHDSLEDHPEKVTKSILDSRFGSRVARLVELCSDTPSDYQGGPKPPWHERKTAYVERLRKEVYPLCRVALADKLHNTRTIVMDCRRQGDKVWARFKAAKGDQLRYHRALVEAFREAQAPHHLVDELDSLVRELELPDSVPEINEPA
ncbi:MAG: HD domain-containing protein [Gammaproteobacteria bacterium]|nr:HD domain-containing protein [Gammaproteobacteria bacterium]